MTSGTISPSATASTTPPATTSASSSTPAPNLEPGDVVVLADGREALVTARVEAQPGPLAALLEVAIGRPQGHAAPS